jgi:hypothetical protein
MLPPLPELPRLAERRASSNAGIKYPSELAPGDVHS